MTAGKQSIRKIISLARFKHHNLLEFVLGTKKKSDIGIRTTETNVFMIDLGQIEINFRYPKEKNRR